MNRTSIDSSRLNFWLCWNSRSSSVKCLRDTRPRLAPFRLAKNPIALSIQGLYRGVLLVMMVLGLAACTSKAPPPAPPQPTPCQKAYNTVQQSGVTVIQTGDRVQMIIPGDALFAPQSTALKPSGLKTLGPVGLFLRCYKKVDVQVTSYTDNQGTSTVNQSVTQVQAQEVADVLWDEGMNVRLLQAKGVGSSEPIASNATPAGRAMNRRIEINLTKVTEPYL